MTETTLSVLALTERYKSYWRVQPETYWLARLMQEVGELASSTVGDHIHSPDYELEQIASIALNWLDFRQQNGAAQAWIEAARKAHKERMDEQIFEDDYS